MFDKLRRFLRRKTYIYAVGVVGGGKRGYPVFYSPNGYVIPIWGDEAGWVCAPRKFFEGNKRWQNISERADDEKMKFFHNLINSRISSEIKDFISRETIPPNKDVERYVEAMRLEAARNHDAA